MCRHDQAEYPPDPISAASARAFVSDRLAGWDLADLDDTVQLLTSELIASAIRHARTPMRLVVAVAGGSVEIGVTDSSPRPRGGNITLASPP